MQNEILESDFESLLNGDIPAIVIRNFYDGQFCKKIASRTQNHSIDNFQNGKLKHLGPFLMANTTNKKNILMMQSRLKNI